MNTNSTNQTFDKRRARIAHKVALLRGWSRAEALKQNSQAVKLEIPATRMDGLPSEVFLYRPEAFLEDPKAGDVLSTTPPSGPFAVTSDAPHIMSSVVLPATPPQRPALFVFHGGGFVLGHALLIDRVCAYVCRKADVLVFNVEYLKAPEHPYPEALNQVDGILEYIANHASVFSIDPQCFFLMGFSAGANLATVCAMRARTKNRFSICGQILHYPYLDAVTPITEKDPEGQVEVDEITEFFNELYAPASLRGLPELSPICATKEDLIGLAPVLCITTDRDVLRKEAIRYIEALDDAGVMAEEMVMIDMDHAYIERWSSPTSSVGEADGEGARINEAVIEALDASVRFIKTHTVAPPQLEPLPAQQA